MKYLLLITILLTACNDIELVEKERVFCERYKTPWVDVVDYDGDILISYRRYGNDTVFIELDYLQECEIQHKNVEVAIR